MFAVFASHIRAVFRYIPHFAGKKLIDEMKAKEEKLAAANPKGERVQPYKTQYMRLCKLYVEVIKEHQRGKVRDWHAYVMRVHSVRACICGGEWVASITDIALAVLHPRPGLYAPFLPVSPPLAGGDQKESD